jgi:hypothetical protein
VTHARRALSTVALAAAAFSGVAVAAESNANADVRIRVGGRAHVRVGGGVRVRAPRVRWVRVRRPPPPPMRIHVGGAIWVGGGAYVGARFSEPPPEPAYCDCGPGNYYPVQPSPSPYVAVAAPIARPPLPRWGIGVGAGGVNVEGTDAGDDLALLGHYRLTPGLILEGEIGKNELADGARVDRRLGASLIYEIGAYNRWAPYVVGGLGVSQVDVGDDYETEQTFGEVGVGLRLALTHRIHLAADIRAGSRSASDEAQPLDAQLRSVTPDPDESEEYTRARLSAMLYF